MENVLIVYPSKSEKSHEVSLSLARGLEEAGSSVTCKAVTSIRNDELGEYNVVAVVGPVQGCLNCVTCGNCPLKEMRAFLKTLSSRKGLLGTKGIVIGLHPTTPKARKAAKLIKQALQKVTSAVIYDGFFTIDFHIPLEPATREMFRELGIQLFSFNNTPKGVVVA